MEWYEALEEGLGERFLASVEAAEATIRRVPETWQVVAGTRARAVPIRRRAVNGFPYAVVYVELETEIRLLAVAHGRRRPGYWRGRQPK